MGVAVPMGMDMRMLVRGDIGEFVREGVERKMEIKKPTVLMALLMRLLRSALFVMQVSAGILFGHFASLR